VEFLKKIGNRNRKYGNSTYFPMFLKHVPETLKKNPSLFNINNVLTSNTTFITIQKNLFSFMCVLFYSSFVCISAYANVYFKTTIIKQNIKIILLKNNIHVSEVHCESAVRFGQALPGFLITAHHVYASLS